MQWGVNGYHLRGQWREGKEKVAKRWRGMEKLSEKEFKGRTTDLEIHSKMRNQRNRGSQK